MEIRAVSLGLERDFKHKARFLCSHCTIIMALVCGLMLYVTRPITAGLMVISTGMYPNLETPTKAAALRGTCRGRHWAEKA